MTTPSKQAAGRGAFALIFVTILLDILGATLLMPVTAFIVRAYSTDALTVGLLSVIYSAAQFVGPYEQPKPNRKVLEMMDSVFGEIEVALLKEWPSKRALLSERGIA